MTALGELIELDAHGRPDSEAVAAPRGGRLAPIPAGPGVVRAFAPTAGVREDAVRHAA